MAEAKNVESISARQFETILSLNKTTGNNDRGILCPYHARRGARFFVASDEKEKNHQHNLCGSGKKT